MAATPEDILDFWEEIGPKKWWTKDDAIDERIRTTFGETYQAAIRGELDAWLETGDGALALIIVLDQFSRNLHRGSPAAFAQDTRCAHLVHQVLEARLDAQMRPAVREFVYLPLMHAENVHDQRLSLQYMQVTGKKDNIEAAEEHLDIIARFGRFPHRNAILGRHTTADEQAFLDGGGFSG